MIDYEGLRKVIQDSGLKNSYIAKHLGITDTTFSRKIQGKNKFDIIEVNKLTRLLNLSDADVKRIFFA